MEPNGEMLGEQGVAVNDRTDEISQSVVSVACTIAFRRQVRGQHRRLIHKLAESRSYSVHLGGC